MSIAGSSSGEAWKISQPKVHLHELAPLGGRATSGRHRRRLERFAKSLEDFPDRPRLGDERDQPDVAATRWALQRKLLTQPRHQLGPRNPGGVVRAGLLIRVIPVTAASRGMCSAGMPSGRSVGPSHPASSAPGDLKTPSVTQAWRCTWWLSAEPRAGGCGGVGVARDADRSA